IARRSRGGVSMTDMSRRPTSDMCSVRGMRVAESARASTFLRISLRRSLWATPKRCSSSTTRRPRSANFTSFESRRCVPMTTSTLPASRSARTFFCSAALRKRLSISMRAGIAGDRDSATEFVQRRMGAFEDAIRLDEVHAFEGNVQASIFGVFQQHEFAAVATGFDLAKSFKLADAVVHVDHVVAGFQLCKIAEETGSANFAAGTFDRRSDVEKIGVAKECEAGFRKRDTFGEGRANQQHRRRFLRAFGGEASGSIFRFAEDVGNFVFAANVSKALDFSRACGGQENGSTGSELGLHVTHAGNDIAVKTGAGPRGKLEL